MIENRDGASAMWRYDTRTGERGGDIPLPEPGVTHTWFLEPPVASTGRSRLYYTLTTPRLAGDVYSHDLRSGETRRLTHSPAELAPETLVAPELGEVESFDGEQSHCSSSAPARRVTTAGRGRGARRPRSAGDAAV